MAAIMRISRIQNYNLSFHMSGRGDYISDQALQIEELEHRIHPAGQA